MATGTTTSTTSAANPVTTTPVSIASSTSSGAAGGSVINVSTIVSALVAAAQAPQQAVIANETSAVSANISALGTLKSALSTFQTSLTALSTPLAFDAVTASSSDSTLFTATAGNGAVGGSYSVTVSGLASAQQLLSGPVPATAAVGTGTLTLSLGTGTFNVAINASNNSLAGIAAAINSAANNPGITATVITGTDGAHLVLTSSQTGAANTIQVAETDGGNALAALTYGTGNTTHYSQQAKAQDASFSVAGVAFTSPSNTVSNAINGVTLNLLATKGTTSGSSSASLTVGNDSSSVEQNIQAFVTAYNTLQSALSGLGSYDATTGTAGPMTGNPVLTGTQNQMRNVLYSLVGSSSYNSLASIGITTNNDGSLSLNSNTLSTALSTNFNAVSQLFSGTNGIAAQLNTQITSDLASNGSIGNYASTLTQQENALTTQNNTLNTQMAALSASLTQQYATLNTLLSSLQTTSAYLTQAFNALPAVQSKANA